MVHNIGDSDAFLGLPPVDRDDDKNSKYWYWDQCHKFDSLMTISLILFDCRHWHYTSYASYELLSSNGTLILTGHKNGYQF